MPVIPLTLTISLCLVATFVLFFLSEHARGRASGPERDSLLPLEEETPRPQTARGGAPARPGHKEHACGGQCRRGCACARRSSNSNSAAS